MSKQKFTPWHVSKTHSLFGKYTVLNCEGFVVAEALTKDEAELIAAAPELYEALESACTNMSMGYVCTKMCQGCPIGKALRKARGESEVEP